MRPLACLLGLLVLGCGDRPMPPRPPAGIPVAANVLEDVDTVTSGPKDALPTDLRTRKTGDDWPAFLGPRGDGTSTEKGLITPWPAAGPRVVWDKEIGTGYATVSISRGRLFLFDRLRNRQRLRAWNAETAESLWAFEYPSNYRDAFGYNGGPRCCPVIDGNRAYIFGPEGLLHCVRVSDGKLVWRVDTQADFNVMPNYFGVGSTPVVEGELLLAQVGGSPKGSDAVAFTHLKGNGSGLVAFDKYTGKVKWKATDELASYASMAVASVAKKRTALLFSREALVGLDPANGKELWRFAWRSEDAESVNASNPVVVGDRVFVTECYSVGGALVEIKGGAAREVWTDKDKGRRKSLACHWMTPIHVAGYLYGSSGRHQNEAELRCVELATGQVMWRKTGLTRSSLMLVDGHFVCLGEDGVLKLIKVNPKKYEEVSSAELTRRDQDGAAVPMLKEPCWAAPVLANGLMYLRGADRLVCVELIAAKRP